METEKSLTASRARVLVVDDSSLVRLYYRDILQRGGFDVEQAANGMEAVEKVLAQPFDLAIIDVNMPKMDGFTLIRSIRIRASAIAALPALVISTEASPQDREDARAAGANFYLVKPVSEANLLRYASALAGVST
jgi:two-component system, chemotaxis family, chemotaxis protein CheY